MSITSKNDAHQLIERIEGEAGKRGLSVRALCLAAGIAHDTIRKAKERGTTPSTRTLQKLADYLSIPIQALMSDDISPTVQQTDSDQPIIKLLAVGYQIEKALETALPLEDIDPSKAQALTNRILGFAQRFLDAGITQPSDAEWRLIAPPSNEQ